MGRRLADGLALIAVLALGAYADDETPAPSTFTHGESVSDTTPGAEQLVRTGGSEGCRFVEAGAYVPSTPTTWRCTCTSARWTCEITNGGYGMSVCP